MPRELVSTLDCEGPAMADDDDVDMAAMPAGLLGECDCEGGRRSRWVKNTSLGDGEDGRTSGVECCSFTTLCLN